MMSNRRMLLLGYLSTLLFPLRGVKSRPSRPPSLLTMQPVAHPGDPVTLGTGPDTLVLTLAGNPDPAKYNSVAVILDGVAVAGPLTISTPGRVTQIFTIKGSWGPLPHVVQIVSGNLPGLGLKNLWVENVSYNFIQGGYTGPNLDNRGGPDVVAALKVWDSAGIVLTFKIPADQAPAAPTPTGSATITGATINGTVHAPAPLADLVTATHAGGALALPPGTWSGSSSVGTACKIIGAGMGKTIVDATGIEIASGKALFVPRVAGVTISDMTIRGAACSDENGAAVCDDGQG